MVASINVFDPSVDLVLGVDRFMGEARALKNVIGYFVAMMAVAKREGECWFPCGTEPPNRLSSAWKPTAWVW